jgi:hypothetical protein
VARGVPCRSFWEEAGARLRRARDPGQGRGELDATEGGGRSGSDTRESGLGVRCPARRFRFLTVWVYAQTLYCIFFSQITQYAKSPPARLAKSPLARRARPASTSQELES